MIVHAYKLAKFALNGWVDWETAKADEATAYDVDDEGWIAETASLLEAGKAPLAEMGWQRSDEHRLWFATLPVDAARAPCPAMIAIEDGEIIWLLSPYDLPWLREALDRRTGGVQ